MQTSLFRSVTLAVISFAGVTVSSLQAQPGQPNAAAAAAAAAIGTTSPGPQARVSPHATTSEWIGADRASRALVMISYGRPYTIRPGTTLVRKIWGGQVPWDKADRLGADEATTLVTAQPLAIAGTTVPAGTYTLYIIPSENGVSKLAFSKSVAKWGIPVDEKNDLARFDLKKETLPTPIDQLTIVVSKDAANPNGGIIKIQWETTQFSLPFAVTK